MSAQIKDGGAVDVLARAVERLRAPHPDHAQDAANNEAAIALHEFRASFAELIEVAASALYDLREVRDRCTSLVAVGLDEQVEETIDRLATSLARVGSTK